MLILDEKTFTPSVDGKDIRITRTEWVLLKHLVNNKDRVCTKPELAEVILREAAVKNNTIETHVSNIREKLGKNVIITIRGFGYQINLA